MTEANIPTDNNSPLANTHTNTSTKNYIYVSLILVLAVAVGFLFWQNLQLKELINRQNNQVVASDEQPGSEQEEMSDPENEVVGNNSIPTPKESQLEYKEGQKYYSSEKLGVEFSYLGTDIDQPFLGKILIQGNDNRIYLYQEGTEPESGQYIEIFSKDPTKTLEVTLAEDFLVSSEYREYCKVTNSRMTFGNDAVYPSSFEFGNIELKESYESWAEAVEFIDRCPEPYTASNGVSYFVYDRNYPDKYAFVSIGQYAIMADDELAWQDTIRFTK